MARNRKVVKDFAVGLTSGLYGLALHYLNRRLPRTQRGTDLERFVNGDTLGSIKRKRFRLRRRGILPRHDML